MAVVATVPDRERHFARLQERLEAIKGRVDSQLNELSVVTQTRERHQREGDRENDERSERRWESSREGRVDVPVDPEASRRQAEAARLKGLREAAQRRDGRRAAVLEKLREAQSRGHRVIVDQRNRDGAEITDHFRVGDLLATIPGQKSPVFASPEGLMRTLRLLVDKTDGRRGGQLDFERRARILDVTGRPEFIGRIRNQLRRFRQIENDTIRVTVRMLFVPDHAQITGSRRVARLFSGDRRAAIVDQYEGEVGGEFHRDYVAHHTVPSGALIYAWTSKHEDVIRTHRGVNVVIEVTPDGNSVTVAPIPLGGDEGKVAWQTLRLTPGQCAVYELPAVMGPDGDSDNTRVLAFITIDAIIPALPTP